MKYLIGIDEAGRGPLAGPIAIGLCMIETAQIKGLLKTLKFPIGKDSKKLGEVNRTLWYGRLRELEYAGRMRRSVVLISEKHIDKKGLTSALKTGIEKGLKKLGATEKNSFIKLDGALKAPEKYTQETIIKGDEKVPVISFASIFAKVERDRKMTRLAKKYPEYGFDSHKGYGTAKHLSAIHRLGPCQIHRQSFLNNVKLKLR